MINVRVGSDENDDFAKRDNNNRGAKCFSKDIRDACWCTDGGPSYRRVSIRGLLWHYDVLELAKVERPKA